MKCGGVYVPKVRNKVSTEDGEESPGVDRSYNSGEPECNTDVGNDDLAIVMRSEHGRGRVEVYQKVGHEI